VRRRLRLLLAAALCVLAALAWPAHGQAIDSSRYLDSLAPQLNVATADTLVRWWTERHAAAGQVLVCLWGRDSLDAEGARELYIDSVSRRALPTSVDDVVCIHSVGVLKLVDPRPSPMAQAQFFSVLFNQLAAIFDARQDLYAIGVMHDTISAALPGAVTVPHLYWLVRMRGMAPMTTTPHTPAPARRESRL
jgi:hypothetical protein